MTTKMEWKVLPPSDNHLFHTIQCSCFRSTVLTISKYQKFLEEFIKSKPEQFFYHRVMLTAKNSLDSLMPSILISLYYGQVLKTTSTFLTELMYVSLAGQPALAHSSIGVHMRMLLMSSSLLQHCPTYLE